MGERDQDIGDGAGGPAPDAGQPRRVRLRLRPTRATVAQARRAMRGLALPSPLAEHAELLVSEVVTNSVRHAGLDPREFIHLTADWSGTRLRVHVRDRPGHLPAVSESIRPAPGAESGWGLYLVDRLATRWGTTADGYWFELYPDPPRQGG